MPASTQVITSEIAHTDEQNIAESWRLRRQRRNELGGDSHQADLYYYWIQPHHARQRRRRARIKQSRTERSFTRMDRNASSAVRRKRSECILHARRFLTLYPVNARWYNRAAAILAAAMLFAYNTGVCYASYASIGAAAGGVPEDAVGDWMRRFKKLGIIDYKGRSYAGAKAISDDTVQILSTCVYEVPTPNINPQSNPPAASSIQVAAPPNFSAFLADMQTEINRAMRYNWMREPP